MSWPYDALQQVSEQAAVVRQCNPGVMTLEGTNTWLLRAPGARSCIVLDPGETDEAHLAALLDAAGEVALIVLSHRHPDHAQGAPALHEATGAPVRAADPALCLDGTPLINGEVLSAAGVQAQVLATPGHTSDSVSLVLGSGPVLTGDSILGRGTSVVAHPDGDLGDYLDSLARLQALGPVPVLPGHGPMLASLSAVAADYLAHRARRLDQVRDALLSLGADTEARAVVELVYADVDESVWWAAELSVRAQLHYLNARGGPAARGRG